MPKIHKLKPFINEKIWGGKRLAALKNLEFEGQIGETWEVSTHSDGKSHTDKGALPFDLSYLVKFIDTNDNLSVQVHPDDSYAKEHENSRGKTECWLILEAGHEAGIYLGFKPGVTRKEFFNAVEAGLSCHQFLNFIPVKKGDFFYLPAGSVHAIGKDILLCEVQQSCDITYRVWDWNRVGSDGKPRDLHVEKAKAVLNFNEKFNADLISLKARSNLLEDPRMEYLARHEEFSLELFSDYQKSDISLHLKAGSSLIVLSGQVEELEAYQAGIVFEEQTYHFSTQPHSSFLVVSGK